MYWQRLMRLAGYYHGQIYNILVIHSSKGVKKLTNNKLNCLNRLTKFAKLTTCA